MNKKSIALLIVLVAIAVLSVSATYYRHVVLNDYVTFAEADCDPETESCFIWICDPEVDGEEYCTGDIEEDTWYYKLIYKNTSDIELCDPYDEDCSAVSCEEFEDCEVILCSDETREEYEVELECTDPETFEW